MTSVVDRQCDCAERSVDRFVFTCPVCVGKVVESSSYRFLTEAVKAVRLDRSVSVSGKVEVEVDEQLRL